MSLYPDQILQGRYRVQMLLHQGGMGSVYRAFDDALKCTVAIKELTPDPRASTEALAQARLQFQREARVLASLSHPNLPRVTNYFSLDGNEYLVMDFVEGQSLDALLAQYGFIAQETVINWMDQLLNALVYIHNVNVIHRDIKPGNIIFKTGNVVVLVDFGLVKLIDPNDPRTLVALRGMGTPEYAPLEQYAGVSAHTDARSDIYSFGATLYHLLTGRAPLPVHERMANLGAQPAPRAVNSAIWPELEAIVLKAMEIYPQNRYQTAREMRQALPAPVAIPPAQGQPIGPVVVPRREVPPPPHTAAVTSKTTEENVPARRWFVIAAAIVLALFLGIAGLYLALNLGGLGGLFTARIATATPSLQVVSGVVPTLPPTFPVPTAIPIQSADTPTIVVRLATIVPPPVPTLPSLPPPPPTSLPDVRGAEGMILIPAGDFWMGKVDADSMAAADENPGHVVFVSGFWVDKYEVSNGQYQKCVEAGQCQKPAGAFSPQSPNEAFGKPGMEEFPVVTLSNFMASDYCKWAGKRLPTEAEWEKAARGTATWVFPWGDLWDGDRANAGKNEPGPEPITAYPGGCSPHGVCNMAGNVAEWIADHYGSNWYHDSMVSNLLRDPVFWSPSPSAQFNVRGGSFKSPIADARVSKRASAKGENAQMNYVGFRCVREAR